MNSNDHSVRVGCLTMVILVTLAIMGICWIGHLNTNRDTELCEFMESRDSFSSDEIDMLYHWRYPDKYDDHNPSKRFIELYNTKIK